jgi:hypothetical protein
VTEAGSEAQRTIDTFASVGASEIHVTKIDINGELVWGKRYSPDDLRRMLPTMIRIAGTLKDCPSCRRKPALSWVT